MIIEVTAAVRVPALCADWLSILTVTVRVLSDLPVTTTLRRFFSLPQPHARPHPHLL